MSGGFADDSARAREERSPFEIFRTPETAENFLRSFPPFDLDLGPSSRPAPLPRLPLPHMQRSSSAWDGSQDSGSHDGISSDGGGGGGGSGGGGGDVDGDSDDGGGGQREREREQERPDAAAVAVEVLSPADVTGRIEEVARLLVGRLGSGDDRPVLEAPPTFAAERGRRRSLPGGNAGDGRAIRKHFHLNQCRSFANVSLVLAFSHSLLRSGRTATTREVYYHYVTHFRGQRECDAAILDAAAMLRVPRTGLGLSASPRGWFCGRIAITRRGGSAAGGGTTDGAALSSVQGLPITREWIDRSNAAPAPASDSDLDSDSDVACLRGGFSVVSTGAKFVVVVEKEGVYSRLSEDRFFDRCPCVLVTGRGFPDVATRALVHCLHTELGLPVVGLSDCNPYGISVMQTYQCGGRRMGADGSSRYGVPIGWAGLRPTQVAALRKGVRGERGRLPRNVLQSLTELDRKRIATLRAEGSPWIEGAASPADARRRRSELELMERARYKVELEEYDAGTATGGR